LGIDEAGRGAVLGPLVVAGVMTERAESLWTLGARDSKLLAREQRPAILKQLWRAGVRGQVVVIRPEVIDQGSLTVLEARAMCRLIQRLGPERVIFDPPVGPRALPHFRQSLARLCRFPSESLSAFPNADRENPVVAAASLLAKVVRDAHIQALRRQYGDFGWGYPSEPKVRAFLVDWSARFGVLPPICRRRWRTAEKLLSFQLHEP
jgi:ribonuclease HII